MGTDSIHATTNRGMFARRLYRSFPGAASMISVYVLVVAVVFLASIGTFFRNDARLNGTVAGLALAVTLVVHHRSRRRLKALGTISRTLLELRNGATEISTLQIDPELGDEAIGWNRLLFEREQLETEAILARISESIGVESGDRLTVAGICDGLPHGVIIVGQDMEMGYANGAAAVLLGTSRSELEGSEPGRFITDDRLGSMIRSALDGTAARCTAIQVIRDGAVSSGVLRLTVCPAHAATGNQAVLILEDISQQKVADEARNSFLAHATHELRTPLTNIQLYIESALETCETDPATTAGCLDVMNRECKRLGRTVSEILSVSQIEAGSLNLQRDDVRMDELLKSVQADYEAYAREKRIQLRFDLPPKLPVLQADRDQVSLAVHNILGNAIKYTAEGGEVSVEVRVEDERIEIEVRDTGIGIGAEDLGRVFEKFYRAQDKRIKGVVGSGLGLSIAREVVRLHGGDITVESELDKGSTFTLVLPVSEEVVHNGNTGTALRCG